MTMHEADPTSFSQPSKDEAIRLMKGGLAAALRDTAARYAIPIFWIAARDRKPWIIDNGSAFMLDCGNGPFLVTANHVYQGYRAAKAEYSDTVCVVGDVTKFDLDANCIATDAAYDVATFRIDGSAINRLMRYANGKLVLTGSQRLWPPNPPQIDRGVFFVGFPGDGRTMRPYKGNSLVEIDWTGYTALAVASGVSDTDIALIFDHEQDFDVGLRPRIPNDGALGGCSGAPVLTFVEERGVFSWRLCGIIYELSDLILRASRADCLNADGSINAHPNLMAYRRRASE